jgi:hypothetical protein
LVGIDPASARVHDQVEHSPVQAERAADAVAQGDDILLMPGQVGDEPRDLGLLAHELTHVARDREPRFEPPVLKNQDMADQDDETLAREVEQRVIDAATRRQNAEARGDELPSERIEDGQQQNGLAAEHDGEQRNGFATHAEPDDPWGGLPAPWEPMPGWVFSGPFPTNGHAEPAPAAQPAEAPQPVHYAETTRPVETSQASQSGGAAEGQPEPDLDVLAHQVYAILQRRLSAERRRYG